MKARQLSRILCTLPPQFPVMIVVDGIAYPIKQSIGSINGKLYLTAVTPKKEAEKE